MFVSQAMTFINARNWLGRTALASSAMAQEEGKCNQRRIRSKEKKVGTKEPTQKDHPVCPNYVASSVRSAKEIILNK